MIPEGLIEFVPAVKRLIAELNDFLANNAEEFSHIKKSHQVEYIASKLSKENAETYSSLPSGVARQLALDRDPHELYLNYTASPCFNVRMGQFKTPFSIENPMSPTVLELIPCTSLVTGYMIGGGDALIMKGSSGRDLGLNVYGSFLKKKLDYSLALMNGQGRNNSDANSQKDFVATVAAHPFRWFTLSTSMILGTGNIPVTPLSTNPNQYICSTAPGITGFKGNGNYTRNRYAAGFSIDTKRLGVRSEYMQGKDADFVSKGYYATACLKRIATNLDLIGSYDWLRIYSGKHNRYLAGLQYWFYPKCRFQLSYDYETADARRSQNALQAQVQVRF